MPEKHETLPLPETSSRAERCCEGPREAVMWNEFNGVVQCHACGTIYTPHQHPSVAGRRLLELLVSCGTCDGEGEVVVDECDTGGNIAQQFGPCPDCQEAKP